MRQAVPGCDFNLTALPFTINGERPGPQGAAPRLGQHNALYKAPVHDASDAQAAAKMP